MGKPWTYKPVGVAFIDGYADSVLSDSPPTCKRLKQSVLRTNQKIHEMGAYCDEEQTQKAIEIIERWFGYVLMPWQRYIVALVHCYHTDGFILYREFLIVVGRGNGKTGFLAGLAFYLSSKAHGIEGYDIDVIANSEDQAKQVFLDVYSVISKNLKALKPAFYISKEQIINKATNSYIKYNTSNAKTKDGKRSACLIFDELHEYQNDENIKVFSSGFGKKRDSRKFKITTRGYLQDGVLDEELRIADEILSGDLDSGICPLIYELDEDKEFDEPTAWVKANPSLPYFPLLKRELDEAYKESKYKSGVASDLWTKRFNRPRVESVEVVAQRSDLMRASRPLPDLTGCDCVCGIDYAMLSDMASIGLLFRKGEERYWLQHSFLCKQSHDFNRIKAPVHEWAERGDLTIIDAPQIEPRHLANWLAGQMEKYNILKVSMDTARLSLMREELERLGFSSQLKNLWLVRPLGIVSTAPVLESWFLGGQLAWGDVPLMRWATNNTKKATMANGNYRYDKIEAKSRKNDPFMALVHAAVIESDLQDLDSFMEQFGALPVNILDW